MSKAIEKLKKQGIKPLSQQPETNITERHKDMFDALVSGEYNNFALVSCFVNGKPTAAICSVNELPDGTVAVQPLFIAPTADMVLTDHNGRVSDDGGGTEIQ